ncbi:MAG: hypothetical protein GX115_17940 [Ruminiclostridium sp.]|nr:hypothetical protein [Ruminiclostridium sp.]
MSSNITRDYHTTWQGPHNYSSRWYQWPVMNRPILYYTKTDGKVGEGISAFGNPAIWWMGIPAGILLLWRACRRKDRTASFLQ